MQLKDIELKEIMVECINNCERLSEDVRILSEYYMELSELAKTDSVFSKADLVKINNNLISKMVENT